MAKPEQEFAKIKNVPVRPFRRAVLRGMAIMLPPLLTIVIFVWILSTIDLYVLQPVKKGTLAGIVYFSDIQHDLENVDPETSTVQVGETVYKKLERGEFVPLHVFNEVHDNLGEKKMPATGHLVYSQYVEIRYLQPYKVVPVFLAVFILCMYLLGKFMAAGVGKFFWSLFEGIIKRLPLIRNVYSSVKQVTDFMFTESEIEYTRVIAVEYPRKGIWSLGLVTSESMIDLRGAANEPVLTVLMPTSPMPVTGFTVTIKKSEAVDLDLTIDQAFQFIVSCGVVVPAHQIPTRENLIKHNMLIEKNDKQDNEVIAGSATDSQK